MKIRSLTLYDFRNFRGECTITFVNELTDDVFPISVLSGSNGSGKTTVLEVIEALLGLAVRSEDTIESTDFPVIVRELWREGLAVLELALSPDDLGGYSDGAGEMILHVVAGRDDYVPEDAGSRWNQWLGIFPKKPSVRGGRIKRTLGYALKHAVSLMNGGLLPLAAGLVYFPLSRQWQDEPVAIEAPRDERPWVDRIRNSSGWGGSLEKLWVWLNYLDLEEQRTAGTHLRPFTERVERILGWGRRITIRQGRVYVSREQPTLPPVRISQLPSGELQALILLGELARRARRGMVCLIDEPELSLHPSLQHAVVGSFQDFAREYGIQFIVATHSLEVVQALPYSVQFLDHIPTSPTRRAVRQAA